MRLPLIQEAHLLSVKRLVGVFEAHRLSTHWLEGVVIVDQVLVHRVKLSLQVVHLLLLCVQFLRLGKDVAVLILHFPQLHLRLIVYLLQFLLVLLVDLVLDRYHVVVIQGFDLWHGRLLVRVHSWRHLNAWILRSERLLHELIVRLLDLGADDFQGLRVGVHLAVEIRSLTDITIAATLRHFD